jgi:hypothetical protein
MEPKKLPAKLCNLDLVQAREYMDPMRRVRAALKLTTTMPKDFHGKFTVDGHKVVIFKSGETPGKHRQGRKSSAHRIYFDLGGALIPVGRIGQFCKAAVKKAGLTRLKKREFGYKRPLAGLKK